MITQTWSGRITLLLVILVSLATSEARADVLQTTAGVMAASTDGMARYLAQDGPIQPALTAIAGIPVRGVEIVNHGISRISSDLERQAQSLAKTSGQTQIQMPGVQALSNAMPSSVSHLGGRMRDAVRSKNNFIRGEAEKGVQAAERLRGMFNNNVPQPGRSKRDVDNEEFNDDDDAFEPLLMADGPIASMGDTIQGAVNSASQTGRQIGGQVVNGVSNIPRGMSNVGHRVADGIGNIPDTVSNMGSQVSNGMSNIGSRVSNGVSNLPRTISNAGHRISDGIGNLPNSVSNMGNRIRNLPSTMGNMGQSISNNVNNAFGRARQAASRAGGQARQAISSISGRIRQATGV